MNRFASYSKYYVLVIVAALSLFESSQIWADEFEDLALQLSDIEGIDLIEGESGDWELVGKLLRSSDSKIVRDTLKRYPKVKNRIKGLPKHISTTKLVVEVSLVEVRKTAFKKLGVNPPDSVGFEPVSMGLDQWRFADPVRGFLDLALQRGEAQIHAKQSLAAAEGQSASFQVGGEFPIKIMSGPFSKVEFKDFGLKLQFQAAKIEGSHVKLSLNSEMSEIDMGSQVDGLPVITKKLLKTILAMRLNEMTAIGGIFRSSQTKQFDGLPFLSEIPGLGRLFRSEDYRNAKSEAYIFLLVRRMDQAWMPTSDL